MRKQITVTSHNDLLLKLLDSKSGEEINAVIRTEGIEKPEVVSYITVAGGWIMKNIGENSDTQHFIGFDDVYNEATQRSLTIPF